MINNLNNIRREIYIQVKHPHIKVHVTTNVSPPVKIIMEHELYYQENGCYPPEDISFTIPETISDRALDITERLLK